MDTPDHLLYTKDHEWANFKDNESVEIGDIYIPTLIIWYE